MGINDLTISEAKQLIAMFGNHQEVKNIGLSMIGKFCIARCHSAGVHAGEVISVDGENVILKDSRRLWSWKAIDGIALSGVAQFGIKEGSKLDALNHEIYLTGVCELIPCSEKSKESIYEK